MAENTIYHPHIVMAVSHEKANNNSNKKSNLIKRLAIATHYMDDPESDKKDVVDNISSLYGVAIDVKIDKSNPDLFSRKAQITFRDTTPGGKFPHHNKTITINPNEHQAIRIDMQNGEYVYVQLGLYPIAEEHCIGEGSTPEHIENCRNFYETFCTMKPVIDEYERVCKYGNIFDREDYEKRYPKQVTLYKNYYKQVNVRGFSLKNENESFNEML